MREKLVVFFLIFILLSLIVYNVSISSSKIMKNHSMLDLRQMQLIIDKIFEQNLCIELFSL